MNCKYCQCENEAANIFCINCGKRLDGKVNCPICHRLIPEEATYCPMCGNRVDGKTVCLHCGRAYQGNFCPGCGVPAPKADPLPSPGTHTGAFLGARNLALYLALICMFIGAFFFGGQFVIADLGNQTPSWRELPDFLNMSELFLTPFHTLRVLFRIPRTALQDGILVFSSVLLSLSYLCYLVFSAVSLIRATVQLIQKKSFSALQLQNGVLLPAATMLISLILLLGVTRGMNYLTYTLCFLKFRLSAPTVSVLIITAALLAVSLVLSFLIRRATPGGLDKKLLFPGGGAVLSLLLLCVAGLTPALSIRTSILPQSIYIRPFYFLFSLWEDTDFAFGIFTCAFYLLVLIFSAILFHAMATRMNAAKPKSNTGLLVFSVLLAVAAIGYLACSIVLLISGQQELLPEYTGSSVSVTISLGASPIIALLGAIALFVLILCYAMGGHKKEGLYF